MNDTVFSAHRIRRCSRLDGMWDFTWLGDVCDPAAIRPETIEFDRRMPVPSAFDAYPDFAGCRGTAAYRTRVRVAISSSAMLRFRGLGLWNRIFVDGVECRTVSLPYSQIEISVPPSSNEVREIVVLADNRFSRERVPLVENFYDFYAYGGIYRSVELHILPEIHFVHVRLTPQKVETGLVDAEVEVAGLGEGDLPVRVRVDDRVVSEETLHVCGGRAAFQIFVPEARSWSAESPHLHTIALESGTDDICQRIGFRTVGCVDGTLTINGKATKLLGYCRHEAHPQFGCALPLAQTVQDLQILKDLGCNFIRGSHYPQDPDFLALCDEMGFYVFEESLGWGNREAHFRNPEFCAAQEEQTRLMIRKSRNHPSVILWGYLNEGASNEEYAVPLYRRLYQLCKEEDPSRPVTYATMFPDDDKCLDYCDVVSVNTYPGWYAADMDEFRPLSEISARIDEILDRVRTAGHGHKPFLISEIGAGAIYGWRDPLGAHWTEDFQAEYMRIACQKVVESPRIAGVSLWQFCDCRTYASARALQRPRAFNNKGTLDEYRRPKAAYRDVRSLFRAATGAS